MQAIEHNTHTRCFHHVPPTEPVLAGNGGVLAVHDHNLIGHAGAEALGSKQGGSARKRRFRIKEVPVHGVHHTRTRPFVALHGPQNAQAHKERREGGVRQHDVEALAQLQARHLAGHGKIARRGHGLHEVGGYAAHALRHAGGHRVAPRKQGHVKPVGTQGLDIGKVETSQVTEGRGSIQHLAAAAGTIRFAALVHIAPPPPP